MIRVWLTTCFFGLALVLFLIEVPSGFQTKEISLQTIVYLPLIFGDFGFQPSPTPSATIRPTKEPTETPTPTITRTLTPFRSATPIPTSTITPTQTLTPTSTYTPTLTPTTTYIPLPVISLVFPSQTSTPTPSRTPSQEVTATPTPGPLAAIGLGQGRWSLLALVCLVWILLAAWLFILLRRGGFRPGDIDQR
jgi:hypothetical protein